MTRAAQWRFQFFLLIPDSTRSLCFVIGGFIKSDAGRLSFSKSLLNLVLCSALSMTEVVGRSHTSLTLYTPGRQLFLDNAV